MRIFRMFLSYFFIDCFFQEALNNTKFTWFFMCIIGAFEDPDIIHVDDFVDPVRDLEVIHAELRLKVCLCCFMLKS